MLSKIYYSYFTLAALTALVQKIVNLLSAQLPDHQMVQTVLTRIQPQLQTALQAIGSTIKQPLTEIVAAADLRRDNTYRSLRDHIKAGLRRQNKAYRTACEALWLEFEKNDLKLYNQSRDTETAAINSLLADLLKPKNQPHLATTNTTQWVTELNNDNQAYVAASAQRSAARSTDDTVNDDKAFKDLKTSLELLENILNTMLAMNDPRGINEVVDEISQYIAEANTAAKQSQNNTGDDEEENNNDTE
ncbi:DUF6261 family protein [Draconibacterium halophilum]|uniref:Uncharacterized protein n=1 Tax=Draconibacterium halophilum TaxID=2706887 RepID=A0A6C0RFK3_9BACT|nr:DUF6261 family protein [Draconibacterium halophilum]QIA09488.1 hypothetical protein G0Q07_18030 [Draconibacterium halophilum]